jgi:phosphatidylserine/phosphatidylglycerophosphate/cardiolipin synthase-like enzyme
MIALVPVSRFRVTYDVAEGRPFSHFETMVLKAIEAGRGELAALESEFAVHPRLITEAVVTLIHAGWVAFGGASGEWSLTAEGRAAIESGESPTSLVVTRARPFYVLLERLTGAAVATSDVRYYTKAELSGVWDRALKVAPRVHDNDLDPALVQHLLPRALGEWIPWIGPIDLISKNNHWVVAEMDVAGTRVRGLPDALRSEVEGELLHLAALADESVDGAQIARTLPRWVPDPEERTRQGEVATLPQAWSVPIEASSFVIGSSTHENLLTSALSSARRNVFVSSAFVAQSRIETLVDDITAALHRGTDVDLLWGYEGDRPESRDAAMKRLRKVAYDARQADANGTLRFNAQPSGSHAKLLIWDDELTWAAVVGSYNWLSAAPDVDMLEVSVRVAHPGLLALLAREAAALWSRGVADAPSSVPDRWQRRAADLESVVVRGLIEPVENANCHVRLVRDRAHESALRRATTEARHRLVIASHRAGPVAVARLTVRNPVERAENFRAVVTFGESSLEQDELKTLSEQVKILGGGLLVRPSSHAKVLVADDAALVGSYNFLATDPFGTAAATRELSLEIVGEEPVGALVRLLSAELSSRRPGRNV